MSGISPGGYNPCKFGWLDPSTSEGGPSQGGPGFPSLRDDAFEWASSSILLDARSSAAASRGGVAKLRPVSRSLSIMQTVVK